MASVSEQQAPQGDHNQVHVVLGQNMLRFLPTTGDVVRCGMVCRDWHAVMAPLPSEVAIDVLTARQGLGMLWLAQNISRVLHLRLELPSEWPTKMPGYLRRRNTAIVCEEACELLHDAKHLQTLAYQLPMLPDPAALVQLSNLQQLTLQQAHRLAALSQDLSRLSKLQVLTIQHCDRLQQLPEALGSLSALRTLTIEHCQALEQLPSTLGDLVALQQLQLIGCIGLDGLPNSISNLTSLTQLVIKPQQDTDCICWQQESLFKVPREFWRLPALLELHIHKLQPTIAAAAVWAEIPECIQGLQQLEELHLEGDALNHPSIFQAIRQLTALTYLQLKSGYTHIPVLHDICYLPNLQQLRIESWVLEELPEDLGQLSSLKQLTLRSLCELLTLPTSLGRLSNLESLVVENVRYVQDLPDSIGDLASLQSLVIDGCFAMKRLPKSIGRLTALQKLNLQWEALVPESVTALTSLTELTIGNKGYTLEDGLAVCVEGDETGLQLTLTEIVKSALSWVPQWAVADDFQLPEDFQL